MVISSVLDRESVWTLTVDILNTICNRDCFADCSLDLTLIVSFLEKLQFWCVAELDKYVKYHDPETELTCNLAHNVQTYVSLFQWFLFSIMSVTILYLGGALFSGHSVYKYALVHGYAYSLGNKDWHSVIALNIALTHHCLNGSSDGINGHLHFLWKKLLFLFIIINSKVGKFILTDASFRS